MAQRERAGGDLYGILGVSPEATSQQIRAAYQQLAGDIVAGQSSAIQRQAIEDAFETLGDPIKRLRYDAQSASPSPPRLQMPALRLPGLRLSTPSVHLPRIKRPDLPHVDPMLAVAVALVAIVGLTVLLLPLLRGQGKAPAPAQSVADLVASPTPGQAPGSPTPSITTRPSPNSPIIGIGPGGTGTSLVPLPSGPGTGGLLAPPPQTVAVQVNEPPFLTGSAIIDMLRAVVAATAVRNGPPPGAAGSPPSVSLPAIPSGSLLQPNPQPAGIPITTIGSVPPVVGAAQPVLITSGAAPAPAVQATPTATPAPNHIAVPGGPISTLGVTSVSGARPPAAATTAPNRFVPAPTPAR